jgi:hypothetical protein
MKFLFLALIHGYWWESQKGRRPLGRPRRRWVENIKMDLREIGWNGRDRIELAQDRDQGSCEHGDEPTGSLKLLGIS